MKIPPQGAAILLAGCGKRPEIMKGQQGEILLKEEISFCLCSVSHFLLQIPLSCLLTPPNPGLLFFYEEVHASLNPT